MQTVSRSEPLEVPMRVKAVRNLEYASRSRSDVSIGGGDIGNVLPSSLCRGFLPRDIPFSLKKSSELVLKNMGWVWVGQMAKINDPPDPHPRKIGKLNLTFPN